MGHDRSLLITQVGVSNSTSLAVQLSIEHPPSSKSAGPHTLGDMSRARGSTIYSYIRFVVALHKVVKVEAPTGCSRVLSARTMSVGVLRGQTHRA